MKRLLIVALNVLMLTATLASAQVLKKFPEHWGAQPEIQTSDYGELPGGYGHGSSTLAHWIAGHLEKDKQHGAAAAQALYECNFEKAGADKVPEDMMVLDGAWAVKAEGGNKFLELPGAPVDTFGVLFGPTQTADVAVSARVFGTGQGRRSPAFGVGLGGVGGFRWIVAPGRKFVELRQGDDVVASAPCSWESGAWTVLRLQIRKVNDAEWKVEAKAWKEGTEEPASWLLTHTQTTEPASGRAALWAMPFSGTPIRFDNLKVTAVAR